MIAKKYRLTEHDMRKVFRKKKPFFSYMFVANVSKNTCQHMRFALLLSGKVAPGSVNRNVFRRKFYDIACEMYAPHYSIGHYDVIVIPKKGIKLHHKNTEIGEEFEKNLRFLFTKITQ